MFTSSRRFASQTRFAGRNRAALAVSAALEQAGGMLLSPVVIVAVCSLLTADLTAMVIPAVAATVAWVVGYATVPLLLSRAGRRLPWTIGASIVRTASLALLAYVLAGDDVSRDQRLRSLLICVTAYALASGLARGASESLVTRVTTAGRRGRAEAVLMLLPSVLALIVGLGSFTLLVDVPRSPLPRLSALFGVAAALSAAAVVFLGRIVEPPNLALADRRSPPSDGRWRAQSRSLTWLVVAASSGAVELLLIVGLVRSMELPRAYLLSGVGAFLAASAVAAGVGAALERAIPFRALIQVSAVMSGLAFALAAGLPTLLETAQSPNSLVHRRAEEAGLWAVMILIGAAQQARRRVLPRLVDQTSTSPAVVNVTGFALAFLPLVLVWPLGQWEPRSWLFLGLGLGLLGIAVGGVISPRREAARAPRVSPSLRRSGPVVRTLGSRYTQ